MRPALFPHQEEGIAWMEKRERGPGGCAILGDEMGLGKTRAVVELVARNAGERPARTLVVAPVACVGVWQKEAEACMRWTRPPRVLVCHGPQRMRVSKEHMHDADVVIATYHG